MNEVSKIVGRELELLCLAADKYEPDVLALKEEYERWHDVGVDYQSIYQSLERLDRHGYVDKKPIDGRGNCYMLTTKGAELLSTHKKLVFEHTSQVEEVID